VDDSELYDMRVVTLLLSYVPVLNLFYGSTARNEGLGATFVILSSHCKTLDLEHSDCGVSSSGFLTSCRDRVRSCNWMHPA
jgi:hypothetical protein